MKKLKATWKLCEEEQTITDDTRREVLRQMLEQEDANWGIIRNYEEIEKQINYLMGKTDAQ